MPTGGGGVGAFCAACALDAIFTQGTPQRCVGKGRYVTHELMNELATISRPNSVGNVVVPAAIADAGERAARRFLEFFAAKIRNKNNEPELLRPLAEYERAAGGGW